MQTATMRQALFAVTLACTTCAAPLTAGEARAEAKSGKFVVHEWGVMIREATTEGTRLAAPEELIRGLPAFVLRHRQEYQPRKKFRSWAKPVLHFYGAERVKVRVITALGRPLVYFPKPQLLEETFWDMGGGMTEAVGMEWTGALTRKAPKNLPVVKAAHWWNTARQVPGLYFNTAGGSERFIFYEGTAYQEPLISGKVSAEALTLFNAHGKRSGPVAVIIHDGEKHWGRVVKSVPAQGKIVLKKKPLQKSVWTEEELLTACRKQWEALGMTPEEARAIVAIWKEDLARRLGFLIISAMPPEIYEKMFPLTITPKPDERVRVGMVFDTLAGESARLGWLPALSKTMARWFKDFSSEDFEVRQAAVERFAQLGDLARPFLEARKENKDAEARNLVRNLLARLKPIKVEKLPSHGRGSKSVLIQRRRDYRKSLRANVLGPWIPGNRAQENGLKKPPRK